MVICVREAVGLANVLGQIMVFYDVKPEIDALAGLGVDRVTIAQRFPRLNFTPSEVIAHNRREHDAVVRYLDEVAERAVRGQALDSGDRIEFRRVDGYRDWLIAGRGLVEGAEVTVTRRDGSTVLKYVGRIVGTLDGLTLAEVGSGAILDDDDE